MSEKITTQTQGAAPLIYSKIAEVMANISAVGKDRTNAQQKFKFRGIDDVMNTLHGVLSKAGVFIVPNVLHEERSERKSIKADYSGNQRESVLFYTRLTIEFTFYAADGSNIKSVVIGEAMDSGDKASNKALSIAYKYACLQVFCIPTEDDKDPDAITHEIKPNKVPSEPLQTAGVNNRVNYQRGGNNGAYGNNGASFDNMAPVSSPEDNARAVFDHMTKASNLPPRPSNRAGGYNQGNLF